MKKFLIFFVFLIFFGKIALAAPSPPIAGCEPSDWWKEYKAKKDDCGDVPIFERECHWVCENCQSLRIDHGVEKVCYSWKKECKLERKVAICNPWQKPERNKDVTIWEEEEIECKANPKCFAIIQVKEFRDGRGQATPTEIHLPTKFYFEIPTPTTTGWGLSCGPQILEIKTNSFTRQIKLSEAFSSSTEEIECSGKKILSDRKILDDLWEKAEETMKDGDFAKLADFLIHFTKDESLRASSGLKIKKEEKLELKDHEVKVEYFTKSETTTYNSYEKLKRGIENGEIKKQIEYFIPFIESVELTRKGNDKGIFQACKHPITNETIDEAYCGHFGGRNPAIKKPEILYTPQYTYSPSQDREVGPCTIPSGTGNFVKLRFCTKKEGCGPEEKEVPKVNFQTVDAPEPIAILAFSRNLDWIITREKNKERNLSFYGNVTRWIDTDWNGEGYPEIPEADFVDFQFCGQDAIDLYKSPFKFRALYRGKKLVYLEEPLPGVHCPSDPELEALIETAPRDCVDVNESCICEKKPEWCNPYCGRIRWIGKVIMEDGSIVEDLDICHPVQNPESLRIKGPLSWKELRELIKKNRLDDQPKDCPQSYLFGATYGISFGEDEAIGLDWVDDPYYGLSKTELTYPIKLWQWDLNGMVQYFPAAPTLNIWQVAKKDSSHWSQKWHFKLTTPVPLKMIKEEVWKKGEITYLEPRIVPMEPEDFRKTIRFRPRYLPEFNEKGEMVFNRIQSMEFQPTPRTLSFKIELGNIALPTIFTQLRYRKLKRMLQSQLKNFTFWEIWPCIKDPKCKEKDINKCRLDKAFILSVKPCIDEWGHKCIWDIKIRTRTTGAVPENLSPPPPDPAKVPRYLRFDPVAGAASYVLEINDENTFYAKQVKACAGEKGYCPEKEMYWTEEKFVNEEEKNYKWRVRSCADLCSLIDQEKFMHCGEFSHPVKFYGCKLSPPGLPSLPKVGQTFSPGSSVSLSWEKVSCNGASIYYHLKVSYSKFPNEKEKECKEMNGKTIIDTIIQNTQFPLSPQNCKGTYYWQIRACLDPDCKIEAGNWSPVWYFNIGKVPPSGGGGGFSGIGTCKKLAPDCGLQGCKFGDLFKLIFNILNCLLWTGIPVLIIIGIASTGITMIFFATNVDLMERVRKIWQGIGIGALIMLLGWTFLNIIFTFLGWRKGVFGNWWNPL